MKRLLVLWAFVLAGGASCPENGGHDAGPEPVFPEDVRERFTLARECRRSIEHDLRHIEVLVDESALAPYRDRAGTFPAGAVVVKAEYLDEGCTDLLGYTAMKRLEEGEGADALFWHWQEIDAERRVLADGAVGRCIACHRSCAAPDGFEHTCTDP